MKTNKLRIIIPLAVLAIAGIAFVCHLNIGTLSAIGWQDVAVLCPIGALTTMLASKTMVPRAVISLILFVIGIILVGRAFCAWVCPVPVWGKLRSLFKKPEKDERTEASKKARAEILGNRDNPILTDEELFELRRHRTGMACYAKPSNSRHIVLGSALVSAAIFGVPVFCLICPIGLSFALVFTLISLFATGDVTWSAVAIPVILLLETVFFRKWCSHICPISALMSLLSRFNKTLRPQVDTAKCVETKTGGACGRCSKVCAQGVDPRHPAWGVDMLECTKCHVCVEECPGHAISMPFFKKNSDKPQEQLPAANASEKAE